MPLIHDTYGKGGVRVMRVARGVRHEVRELAVDIMLEGGFAAAFTAADNGAVVATDTLKNLAYVVALQNLDADAEPYGRALARALRVAGQVDPVFVDEIAELPATIVKQARAGDVVISMGAGSIGAVPAKVVDLLAVAA